METEKHCLVLSMIMFYWRMQSFNRVVWLAYE
jgi:hypothetical protein